MLDRDFLLSKKTPSTPDKHIGVEIEFLMPRNKITLLENALVRAKLQWYVNLGTDGSVIDNTYQPQYTNQQNIYGDRIETIASLNGRPKGMEARILTTEKDGPEIINKVCALIKKYGGYVNTSCGLHVHLDMRYRDLEKVYNNFFFSQSLLYSTQPKARNGYYSKKQTKKATTNNVGRYYGVNRASHVKYRTIELRMHEGTVDSNEINMWIGSLIKIASIKETLNKQIKSFKEIGAPQKVQEYFNDRITRYSGKKSVKATKSAGVTGRTRAV